MSKIAKRSKSFISILIVSILILSMSIPAVCAESATLTDISNHWAKNEISAWVTKGLITGYKDNTFKPDSSITRAEFIALVNRLFAFSEKSAVSFTDVKESDWFYSDFAKAGKAGYLVGYEGGKVDPNGFITRQEVAAIAAKVKSLQEDAAGANGFADAAVIPAFYKGFIGAVTKAKIMTGYPDLTFGPLKGITRAESVITLNRLVSLKDTVKIEAIKDQTTTVNATAVAALKMLPADAKASIQNSDDKVVQATLSGTNIQLRGLKVGTATITLTGKKDGMLDGVVTFKVTVGAAVVSTSSGGSGGGGGGGGSHDHGDNTNPTPVEDDTKLTEVKAVGTATTVVTGKYAADVTRIEVIYGTVTLPASLNNGTFNCSITPGLAKGTQVTVKGYAGTKWLDTDVVTVAEPVEDDSKLTEVKAIVGTVTKVSGKYAAGVTKVEVIYGNVTEEASLNNGTFNYSITPGLEIGAEITVKGYAEALWVDTDVVEVAEDDTKLTLVQAIGTMATQVSGNYASGVTKVEVICGGETYTAELRNDGKFFQNIYPGLENGTAVTVKGYAGALLLDTDVVKVGDVIEKTYIDNLKAAGTIATQVTGNYYNGVTKVEVICGGETYTAELRNDGTFFQNIYPGLEGGTSVTIKAYVGTQLVDTQTFVTEGEVPVEKTYIDNLKAAGTMATQVTGNYYNGVTKVEVICGGETYTAELRNDGTFFQNIYPGLASGTTVTVKAYVGTQLVATKTFVTEGETPPTEEPTISNVKAESGGTVFTLVSGNYTEGITKVEVIYTNASSTTITKTARLKANGEFSYEIIPGLSTGATVTVKAYAGEVVKSTMAVNVQ